MPNSPLNRAQIYEIRNRAEQGQSAPRILREMDLPVSLETVRRVIRRDSHREIGVGAGERAFVSNRLSGESRRTGEPVAAYQRTTSPEIEEQLARMREVAAAMRAQPRELGAMPDPFDLPAEEGPTAEELIAARVEAAHVLAEHGKRAAERISPFETADELLAQMNDPAQRA